MEAALADQERLVAALRNSVPGGMEVIETHISWVLLAGDHAYKIKKAVNFGFLDFSTLAKRRFCCEEELRLNRRLAPDLYLDVTPVTGGCEQPVMNGHGEAIEYAVKMRRFSQSSLLDRVLQRGELTPQIVDAIAGKVADFHARIEHAGAGSPFGTAERVHQPVRENFEQIRARLDRADPALEALAQWSEQEFQARAADFTVRKQAGFIRECHGDLHLGNMLLLDGEATAFDGIEFSENLRWVDVISEIAFLAMDLEDRHHPELARRFLNAYLEVCGDYAGLAVLRYYRVYRAMVRAKVACIRAGQGSEPAGQEFLNYLALAERLTHGSRPFIAITHGVSGSGKTTVSQALLEAQDLFRVRSDVERKRLFGLRPEQRSGGEIYAPEATRRTYQRLAEVARCIVQAGYPAIVDAAFLRRSERLVMRELAQELGMPFVILDCTAADPLLRERVDRRMQQGHDASEADAKVLENQLRFREPLDETERRQSIAIDTALAVDGQALARRLSGVISRPAGP